jgi:hypothetical protein
MHKLQDMIDTVFGDVSQKPGSHSPNDAAIERDRRFAEAAGKMDKLRQARLSAQSRQ